MARATASGAIFTRSRALAGFLRAEERQGGGDAVEHALEVDID